MVIAYAHARAELADDEAHALPALGRPAQHPVPRLRRARAASGRRHARRAGARRRWPGSTTRPRARRARSASTELHHDLRRDTARCATDAIAQVSSGAEQLGLCWDAPGLDRRRRRGRPRPAGRPGGGRRGDPGRPAAHRGPERLQDADGAAARAAVRRDPRQGAVLLRSPRPASRRSTAQHPAGHDAGHAPRRGGPAADADAGAGRRQPRCRC